MIFKYESIGIVMFLKKIMDMMIMMRVVVSIICCGIDIVFLIVSVKVIVFCKLEKNIICCMLSGIFCVFLKFKNSDNG